MEVLRLVSLIAAAAISFALGLFALGKNQDLKHRLFFLFALGVSIETLAFLAVFDTPTNGILALLADTVGGAASFLLVVAFYHLILIIQDNQKKYTSTTIGYVLVFIVFVKQFRKPSKFY
jgi:hypothetical protein